MSTIVNIVKTPVNLIIKNCHPEQSVLARSAGHRLSRYLGSGRRYGASGCGKGTTSVVPEATGCRKGTTSVVPHSHLNRGGFSRWGLLWQDFQPILRTSSLGHPHSGGQDAHRTAGGTPALRFYCRTSSGPALVLTALVRLGAVLGMTLPW